MRKKSLPKKVIKKVDDHHDNPIYSGSTDSLNRLPDDILVYILSGFPLKEAAATSLISKRWRYLWCQTRRLDFPDNNRFEYLMTVPPRLLLQQRNKYMNWVNVAVQQHRMATIEEFKISFDLNKDFKDTISNWIEFALSKKVQRLELDLMDKVNMRRDFALNFLFPNEVLDRILESLREQEESSSSSIPRMPSTKVTEMNFLKVLVLKSVNINDETMSKILVSCQALKYLTVQLCGELMNIKSDSLHSLIYLEVSCCPKLESIEICDSPDLTYFYYVGRLVNIKVDKPPKYKWYDATFVASEPRA